DRLALGVLAYGVDAVLAPDAAGPEAAEGHVGADDPVGVDPDGAGPQPGRHPVGAVDVLGPDGPGQPELGAVGDGDRLVLVAEGGDRHHRAEDLLLHRPHRAGGVD